MKYISAIKRVLSIEDPKKNNKDTPGAPSDPARISQLYIQHKAKTMYLDR